jgi:predicted metal-dependent hydrolase
VLGRPLKFSRSRRDQPALRKSQGQPHAVQLDLFGSSYESKAYEPPKSADPTAELLRRLNRLSGGRIRSVSLTDNRRTILSVKPGRKTQRLGPSSGELPLELRIHRAFVSASEEILRSVAAFLESARGSERSRSSLAVIREHFNRHRTAEKPTAPRATSVQPFGEIHDLREIADDLNGRYFEGRLKVHITWGKASGETAHDCRRTRTSSLQLGSYSYEDRLIRVHRVLDRPGIPRYVVESVVYHELLHADLPPIHQGGRRLFHTHEFRRREREFRHFLRADEWVKQNLQELLRARRGNREARRRAPRS